jgi:ribose transport system permease protein
MNDDQERPASHARVDAVLEDLESELDSEAAPAGLVAKRGPLAAILRMRGLSVLGATVLLFVVLSLATSLFPAPDNLLLVARQISILAIIATGITFLFIAREIDLSVGSIYGFMVVTLAFLIAKWSVDPWLAVLITVVLGTMIGLVSGLIVTQPWAC